MSVHPMVQQIEIWRIDRLVFYAKNPRKNDGAVDRMRSSIGEFGFKIRAWCEATVKSLTVISVSRLRASLGSRKSQ
jgi:hypothetical protein